MRNPIDAIVFCCLALAGSRMLAASPVTRFYRTTFEQGFREVVHADWGDEIGPGSVIIDLDAAIERQTFRGLGGSFAEASCFTLMRMPEEKRAAAFEMLFGQTGLRLSIGRIHCAASDYSLHLYSYAPVAGDVALGHFTIDDDRKWVIPAIREAQKVNPSIFFFSSPWSAPGWMKENGRWRTMRRGRAGRKSVTGSGRIPSRRRMRCRTWRTSCRRERRTWTRFSPMWRGN